MKKRLQEEILRRLFPEWLELRQVSWDETYKEFENQVVKDNLTTEF